MNAVLQCAEATAAAAVAAAVRCHHLKQCDTVKVLVNVGAPIAAASTSDTMGMVAANTRSTPLHLAAMKVSPQIVARLKHGPTLTFLGRSSTY
jgi:urease accessory protein UreF